MSIIILLWQCIFGTQKGTCEICGEDGWKQYSIVDPGSPGLKTYCSTHHLLNSKEIYQQERKCYHVKCQEWQNTWEEKIYDIEKGIICHYTCRRHAILDDITL